MKFHDLEIVGKFISSGSLKVPSGPSGSRPTDYSNLETGSIFYNTDTLALEIFTGVSQSWWQSVGSGSSVVSGVASSTLDLQYVLVAGGGGGASWRGGGGGAGGYVSSTINSVDSGSSFSVTVGAGGTASTLGGAARGGVDATNGQDSGITGITISQIVATGGGQGGEDSPAPASSGTDGGSGGGAAAYSNATAGSGTIGQGNAGGMWTATSGNYGAGGGGGAGTAGSDGNASVGGDGGDGIASSITGTSVARAGGGGGGVYSTAGAGGAGGIGGGGNSGGYTNPITNGIAGTANTGGGGGGGANGVTGQSDTNGGPGGSGVAIFAYESGSTTSRLAGGIVGDAGNGNKYHQFNSSGTLKVGSAADFQIVTDSLLLNFDAGNYDSRGASTVTDLSGNGNNGTVGNATLSGYYYSFNGSNSYITAPPTSFVSSAYSIETWLYKSSIDTTYDCIYAAGSELQTYFRSNFIEFYLDTGGGGAYEVDGIQLTGLSAATWYHYTITDNGSGSVKIYLNGGTQTNTATYSGNPGVYSGTPRIGDYAPSAGAYPFSGNIAQFRIYTKALSDAEVLQNYNATKTNFV